MSQNSSSGKSLLGRIKGLVSRKDEEPQAAAPKKQAAKPLPESLTEDGFSLALEQMLSQEDGASQTKLQIISLVEFREAVGERWVKASDKVMLIAEGVINLHLGSGNFCGRKGTDFFILLFRTCSQAEGKRRAQIIAQELGTRLLGDQFVGGERPQALAAELAAEDALNPDGSINLDAIGLAVGTLRSLIAAETKPDSGQPPPSWLRPGDKGEAAKPLPPIAAPELPTAKTTLQDPGWQAMQNAAKPQKAEPDWQPVSGGQTHQAQIRTMAMEKPISLPAAMKLSLSWRPGWLDNESIGLYSARLYRDDQTGNPALESGQAYPRGDEAGCRHLDRFLIDRFAREAQKSQASDSAATLLLPIHWQTVTAPDFSDIILPLANLTPAYRERCLVVEIFAAPVDIKPPVMKSAIAAAQGLGRDVMLRTSLTAPRAAMAYDCGARFISLDLAELPPNERTDDSHLLTGLTAFLANAKRAQLGVGLWGIRRRALLVGAVRNGFSMVNGPALMHDIAQPAKVLPAPKSRFNTPS